MHIKAPSAPSSGSSALSQQIGPTVADFRFWCGFLERQANDPAHERFRGNEFQGAASKPARGAYCNKREATVGIGMVDRRHSSM